jgi:hypothetical protein
MMWRGIDLGTVTLKALALDGETGRRWYIDSRASIEDYAFRHGFHAGKVCDVLAILSPRVTVEYSIRLADSYLKTGSAPGAMKQRLAALARYETSGLFNGPKVNAFSAALRGDPDAIVIDAWMYRAARESRTTPKAYRETAARIQDTADVLGWPAAETQAAIWQGARAFVGYAQGYKPMILEGF